MNQDPLVGRVVAGRFKVKRLLGEGGMASVYVAEQDEEPHEIALKIMSDDLTRDRTFVRRFEREAKAASRVQHPNCVKIFAYGVDKRQSYIAMELVHGDDLYQLLERGGALTQARAARILIEVCDALVVAHELGIVHRDLKPENIMVVKDDKHPNGERVKVLDFGIAKLIAADAIAEEKGTKAARFDPTSSVTRAGTFIGTPAYMSPEQCALMAVDTRADIYTCGVLLFQLLTCRLPFEGETPLHTATLHIHQPPRPPSEYAPKIDPRLEQVILKALSKRPAERHQTARHLAATLRKILPDLADVAVATEPLSSRRGVQRAPSFAISSKGSAPPPAAGARPITTKEARAIADAPTALADEADMVMSRAAVVKDVAPPPVAEAAPLESARTMVAEGLLGPAPPVVVRGDGLVDSRDTEVRPLPETGQTAVTAVANGAPDLGAMDDDPGSAFTDVGGPLHALDLDTESTTVQRDLPPEIDDAQDRAKTLVRPMPSSPAAVAEMLGLAPAAPPAPKPEAVAPRGEGLPPARPRKQDLSRTEIMDQSPAPGDLPTIPRGAKPTLKSADSFRPNKLPPPPSVTFEPLRIADPGTLDEFAATPPRNRVPPLPPQGAPAIPPPVGPAGPPATTSSSSLPNVANVAPSIDAQSLAASGRAQIVQTIPLSAHLGPALPQAAANNAAMMQRAIVQTLPMGERPVAATLRFNDPRSLSGKSGLLIGFCAGLIVMAVMVVLYLVLVR